MKRTFVFRPHAAIASALLTLSLAVLAGSSGCGGGDTASAGAGDLDKSEIASLKKESKNGREFIDAVKRKRREMAGIVDPIDELKRKQSDKGSPK